MPSANLGAVGRRATQASALAILICSAPAHAITVDGDLSDLMSAVSSNTLNKASGTDALGGAGQESGNGFDIEDMYAYYDKNLDTLYLGFNTYGTAGNSGLGDTAPSIFGTNDFFSLESYGFQINNSTQNLYRFDVFGPNSLYPTGYTSASNLNGVSGLNPLWAVSTSNNGIEFSLSNLSGLLTAGSTPLPTSLTISLFAGSSENNLSEDVGTLSLQAVPVPAAAWLFGSGLLGLVASARKRRRTL